MLKPQVVPSLKFESWKVIGTLMLPNSLTHSGRCRQEYFNCVFLMGERESTRCTSWCHDWRCRSIAGLRPGLGEKIGIKPSRSSWHVLLCEFDMEFPARKTWYELGNGPTPCFLFFCIISSVSGNGSLEALALPGLSRSLLRGTGHWALGRNWTERVAPDLR